VLRKECNLSVKDSYIEIKSYEKCMPGAKVIVHRAKKKEQKPSVKES